MCGPALGIVGGVVSGIGSAASASAQAGAQDGQADYYDRQAETERQRGTYLAEREDRSNRKKRGKQVNFVANSGLSEDSFDPSLEDSEREMALDIQAIQWNAEVKAQSLNEQADIKRAEADATRTAGTIGALSPIIKSFSGAATTIGGFG